MFCTEFNTRATTTKALQSTVILFTARMNCAEDLAWPVEDQSVVKDLSNTDSQGNREIPAAPPDSHN